MFPSRKWLYPGMGVKRWIALLMLGFMAFALASAMFTAFLYRNVHFPGLIGIIVYYGTLQFIPHPFRELFVGSIGVALTAVAIWRLNASLMEAVTEPHERERLVDIVYERRRLRLGPKIVTIGGGTGQSILLRGLKEYTGNLTAIVTVADDGGSSGRLRRELGGLPPGDVRQCIGALAVAEPLMMRLLNYRFNKGSGLEGHSLGNLMMFAMAELTGSFEAGIRELSRVLAVRGQVLPSTLESVVLCAELTNGEVVRGESAVGYASAPIRRVFLQPEHPRAHSEAVRAILEADCIVLAPGSLYTSLLPNLLVDEVCRAVVESPALKIYVCNVATEPGETAHYGVEEHIAALQQHAGEGLFDVVLVNNTFPSVGREQSWELVRWQSKNSHVAGVPLIPADVIDVANPSHHSPSKLAPVIMRIYADYAPLKRAAKQPAATAAS